MEVVELSSSHWFLPETPDVRGTLRRQLAATIRGAEGLAAWAAGDLAAAQRVRDAEHEGDSIKRELLESIRAAFVLPLEPEDVFTLSRSVDLTLNYCRDLVNESEVMEVRPDEGIAEMASALVASLGHIDRAFEALGADPDLATEAADAAIKEERRMAHAYYSGMGALLELEDMRQRIGRRELYRRCFRIGEVVVEIGDRVVYAVVKQT
jgi:uncharacterized protein Yka (UPF0111/DUF47 family)